MNSLQKHNQANAENSHQSVVVTYEKNLQAMSDVSDVEILLKKLQYLGLNFDPFGAENTSECQQIMDDLGLSEHLKNPYLATNILLSLLDKTEERIHKLKQ
ncbi:MAG TPA: hypothetical protein VNJ01_15375 [Bacteriovoracaceae bacterium]|nr:hypothetical protein [Bacteriovoracaceae bacterium]